MKKLKVKNLTKTFGVIIPVIFLTSCMVQLSSVPKIRNLNISEKNTSIIAISAEYRMNMSSSKDVKFYLQEITTGKIISPQYRDDLYNNLYINVPIGVYRISLITIKDAISMKSILFNDSAKTITKFLRLQNTNYLENQTSATGFSLSGAILIGDKDIVYPDTISNLITIEPNSGYFLGEYQFEGYVESIFNDMPNIRITKKVPVSKEKLDSFSRIYSDLYPDISKLIKTNESLFNKDLIYLSR